MGVPNLTASYFGGHADTHPAGQGFVVAVAGPSVADPLSGLFIFQLQLGLYFASPYEFGRLSDVKLWSFIHNLAHLVKQYCVFLFDLLTPVFCHHLSFSIIRPRDHGGFLAFGLLP